MPELLRQLGVNEDYGNIVFGLGMIGALAGGAGMAEVVVLDSDIPGCA